MDKIVSPTTSQKGYVQIWAPGLYPRTLHLVSQVKYMAPRRSTGSISLGKAHKESDETFYLIGLRTLTTYFSALFCFISA